MTYKVVTAPNVRELVEQVKTAIAEGWKPIGGVNQLVDSGEGVIGQAMTWEP